MLEGIEEKVNRRKRRLSKQANNTHIYTNIYTHNRFTALWN